MAMYKPKKQKRYRRRKSRYLSDYRHRKSTRRWSIAILTVTLIALFAVGVFVIGPFFDNFIPVANDNVSSGTESEKNVSNEESQVESDTSSVVSTPEEKKGSIAYFLTKENFFTDAALESSIEKGLNEDGDTLIREL